MYGGRMTSLIEPLNNTEDPRVVPQWARAHQDLLLPQWRNVLFSDESRFGLVSNDCRERGWRERGGQNRLATAIGVGHYRGGTQIKETKPIKRDFVSGLNPLIIGIQNVNRLTCYTEGSHFKRCWGEIGGLRLSSRLVCLAEDSFDI
nr:unnamed protein product [Callosobruchus chinensis]